MSKINLFITLLLLTIVGCGATYWICRDDYATDNPLARGIIANPITNYIKLSWYSGYLSIWYFNERSVLVIRQVPQMYQQGKHIVI